jgi:hypothetical protein
MKKWILLNFDYFSAGYLGFSLGTFCGLDLLQWKWWAIVLPTLLLFAIARNLIKKYGTQK